MRLAGELGFRIFYVFEGTLLKFRISNTFPQLFGAEVARARQNSLCGVRDSRQAVNYKS